MTVEIIPFNKVDKVEFGMSIQEVKNFMDGLNYDEDKNGFGMTLIYKDIGLGYYFKENYCVNVSCCSPINAVFNGLEL